MNVIQYVDKCKQNRVGLVESKERIIPLQSDMNVYQMAIHCIKNGQKLEKFIADCGQDEPISYSEIVENGRLLPPIMLEPKDIVLSGTGLTHLGSGEARNNMHTKANANEALTDSIKMFNMGLEGGKPKKGGSWRTT